MLKQTITFTNLDGELITRDYYFNLNKAEIMELQLNTKGGMEKFLQKINDEQDVNGLVNFVKKIILLSYGEKDDDGIRFIKKKNGVRLADDFEQTEAFAQLYLDFISGENAVESFSKFLMGILPADIQAQAKEQISKQIEVKK